MRATALALALLTGTAAAQPGATSPIEPARTLVPLTPAEWDQLDQGEITGSQHAGGTMVGFLLGFGLGQAVQGRWHSRGWKFAIAETITLGFFIGAAVRAEKCDCERGDVGPNGFAGLGAIAWMTVRMWEGFDALIAPGSYNDHIRTLRVRAGYGLYLAPPVSNDRGTVAGLGFTF